MSTKKELKVKHYTAFSSKLAREHHVYAAWILSIIITKITFEQELVLVVGHQYIKTITNLDDDIIKALIQMLIELKIIKTSYKQWYKYGLIEVDFDVVDSFYEK